MNEVDVVKIRSVSIRDKDYFGWTITCFDDETQIQYYEQEEGKSVIKHTYNFTKIQQERCSVFSRVI